MRQYPRLAVLLCLLFACAAGGGVARWDAYSLLYVRPLAVLALGLLAIVPGHWNWNGLKAPLLLLAAFTATIAIQLIPLPPTIWAHLPGREPYVQAAAIADIPQPWRPISLMPFRTANSLLATLPAFAALVALAGTPRRQWRIILDAVLVVCCASAALGTLQYTSGILYPYSPSDKGLPIGVMANRNHQALLLIFGQLLLAHWGLRQGLAGQGRNRAGIALAGIALLTIIILLTGSRTGLVLMGTALLIICGVAGNQILRSRIRSWLLWPLVLSPFAIAALGAYVAQTSSFTRLGQSIGEDMRAKALPTVWWIARHYLPWGSGFGTFDRVFMQFEPEGLLVRGFYNRAHSDPLEVLIAGGIPSICVVALFLCWFAAVSARKLLHRQAQAGPLTLLLGTAIVLALLASLGDYPLRNPLMTLLFALLCGLYAGLAPQERLLATERRSRRAEPTQRFADHPTLANRP